MNLCFRLEDPGMKRAIRYRSLLPWIARLFRSKS